MYDAYNNDSITTQLIWDNPYIAQSSMIHQNMCLTEEHKMPLKKVHILYLYTALCQSHRI